jgi:hypothetical protein
MNEYFRYRTYIWFLEVVVIFLLVILYDFIAIVGCFPFYIFVILFFSALALSVIRFIRWFR